MKHHTGLRHTLDRLPSFRLEQLAITSNYISFIENILDYYTVVDAIHYVHPGKIMFSCFLSRHPGAWRASRSGTFFTYDRSSFCTRRSVHI